jgi:hypothetical protein
VAPFARDHAHSLSGDLDRSIKPGGGRVNCWKCGKPTERGAAECGECELGFTPSSLDDDANEKIEIQEIDWDKVTEFEDLKLIVRTLGWCDMVVKNSPEAEKLKRFLKEKAP